MASAAASTPSPELGREGMIASVVRRCRRNWNFERLKLRGKATL
jgi:hypothetical protein